MSYQIQIQDTTGLWIVLYNGEILGRAAEPQTAIQLARQRVDQINDPITGRGPGTIPPLTTAIAGQLLVQAEIILGQFEKDTTAANPPDPEVPTPPPPLPRPQAQQSAAQDPQSAFVFDENGELVPANSVQGQEALIQQNRVEVTQPAPVATNYSSAFDPETQTWGVWDNNTGTFVQTGLTESAAQSAAQGFVFREPTVQPITAPRAVGGNFAAEFNDGTGPGDAGTWYVVNQDTGEIVEVNLSEQQAESVAAGLSRGDPGYADVGEVPGVTVGNFGGDTGLLPDQVQAQADQAALEAAARDRARIQATLENQQRQADQGDWRVKIRLAPGARYLYRGSDGQGTGAGIMAPLAVTDGVIFPYTPQIETSYRARYTEQDLTHSNYRGYFYHGSHVDTVQITGVFTAQDTPEANYLLAVIHFFRSATKMFYGQDEVFGGAPPPVVFLQGLGQYQFSRHPCVITSFNYRLPSDVDYIRADVQPISGLNIQVARDRSRQNLPTNIFTGALARLSAAGTPKGAINIPPPPATLGQTSPTYVPTKMEISIELLPMQTRSQVSREFSLEKFSNGNLQRGGFW